MLTRLRVKGFKNLLDVDVRFGPFTCIAGKNGSGKSNLFDAIQFLSLLAQHPIMEAAEGLRETRDMTKTLKPERLFTTLHGYTAPEIRMVADLVIDRKAVDDFGNESEAVISTVQYEIALRLSEDNGIKRLELVEEWLRPKRVSDAKRDLGFKHSNEYFNSAISGLRRNSVPFISTEGDSNPVVKIHREGSGGRQLPAPKSSRTALEGHADSDYPTILAVQKELASWQTLMLEPSSMRAPSQYRDDPWINAYGANMPATIQRLLRSEHVQGQVCAELANRLGDLLDDVRELRIRDDAATETWTLEVCGRDGVFHPAQSLSDGTLRFLVLATLALDPERKGMMCLEEPENGVHPERIRAMLDLLHDIAVDPEFPVCDSNPLRQVVVNTHSPVLVGHILPDDLVYLDVERLLGPGKQGALASVRVPEGSWRAGMHEKPMQLTLDQAAMPYLSALHAGEQGTFADICGDAWGALAE